MDRPLIAHVGIAVADLEASIELYRLLTGGAPVHIQDIPERGLRLAMFDTGSPDAGGKIELLAATSPDSVIGRFIAAHGEGFHHVCIYVDDLDARLVQLKAAGFQLIDQSPRVGADGMKIAFVHPSSTDGVLIELQERTTK